MRFAIRNWMSATVEEFDNYDEAKKCFDKQKKELLDDGAECDLQFYQILEDYNNVD